MTDLIGGFTYCKLCNKNLAVFGSNVQNCNCIYTKKLLYEKMCRNSECKHDIIYYYDENAHPDMMRAKCNKCGKYVCSLEFFGGLK